MLAISSPRYRHTAPLTEPCGHMTLPSVLPSDAAVPKTSSVTLRPSTQRSPPDTSSATTILNAHLSAYAWVPKRPEPFVLDQRIAIDYTDGTTATSTERATLSKGKTSPIS